MFANWPVATQRRVLVSLPVSELSDDLFPQRGRKRLLARDHAGLPNRLAHLIDVGAAAAAREVSLEPLPLVGRQRTPGLVVDATILAGTFGCASSTPAARDFTMAL